MKLLYALSVALLWGSTTYGTVDTEDASHEKRQSTSYTSPGYYPSPKGGWLSEWSASYEKASAMVAKMTLAEKVNVTTGIGIEMGRCVGNTGPVYRLGFPSICLEDSPVGVRYADLVTAFPSGITAGATWDEDLIYARGLAIGQESKAKGVHVIMGPVVGPLGRAPQGGRNWEGFGADPYLQGVAAFQAVSGIQDAGTQATIKHFIGNEQEHFRGDGQATNIISSDIDDRTLHEVYLWPFAEAVRSGVASLMCSYNMVNGSYACQNPKLLNDILKDELGFQGYVMSDWLGTRSAVAASIAGLDMNMPGDGAVWAGGNSFWGPVLSQAILNGSIPVDRLDDQVTRIIAAWYQLGQDQDYPELSFSAWTKSNTDVMYHGAGTGPTITVNTHVNVQADHATVAHNISRDAITLLKNADNILPLGESDVIRVFGTDAGPNPAGMNGCTDRGCDQGVLGMGWGSGTVDYPSLSLPIDAISARASNVDSVLTDSVTSQVTSMAATADANCIVFVSADSGESYITVEGNMGDRNDLNAWHSGNALVTAVANACENTIVVIHSVGPILVETFADLDNVKAIVMAHLPGQEAGTALTDILFGDYSPSGKLPYTMGKAATDWPSSVDIITSGGGVIHQQFSEGLYVDYKYFDAHDVTPRYEFGFGMSYTTFEFSDLTITANGTPTELPPAPPAKGSVPTYATTIPAASEVTWPASITSTVNKYIYPYLSNPTTTTGSYPYPSGYSTSPEKPLPSAGGGQGGNPALWDVLYSVTAKITNTGKMTGKEVAQLYLEFPSNSGYDTPVRQLRGFKKIELAPEQSGTVTFQLTRKDLSVWDVVQQNWVIPGGGSSAFTVHVGNSSRNLLLSCTTSGQCTSSPATTTTASTATSTKASSTSSSATSASATSTSATKTSSSASATTTAASCAAVTQYGQCGGIGFTGCTTCVSSTKCTVLNDYYSQCL